ncbi:MAG: RCC1 domain-containing protein, partial [Micrococcales bacterium]|nr:RCC1 domain-containing protein [Micrococcales bacterium]
MNRFLKRIAPSTLAASALALAGLVAIPTVAGAASPVEPMVVAVEDSAYALASDGVVWAWGLNSSGQLG